MTPEEAQAAIDHLSTTKSAWTFGSGLGFVNFQHERGDLTFFRNSRRNGTLRLYGWGATGTFNLPESTNPLQAAPPALANPALYDEVFPGEFHGILNFATQSVSHKINTEEIFELMAVHNPLQNIVSIAASYGSETANQHMVVACTADGALYAAGNANIVSATIGFNPLGLGNFPPYNPSLPLTPPGSWRQTALQRVYGKDSSFSAVKFVKVQTTHSTQAFFALDHEGHLWISGNASFFASASDFEENSTNLLFFSKRAVTQYYDKTATLVSEELLFTDFWVGFRSLLAMTADGRIFGLGNRFALGRQLDTRIFHEVGGFVDTVAVTEEGNLFLGAPGEAQFIEVEFSAPAEAYGERATGFAIVDGGKLKAVVITNSGWGYTSPPTISFVRGAGAPPAGFVEGEAECTIYTGTWKHASVAGHDVDASLSVVAATTSLYFDHYVAVNEHGVVYSWGAVSDMSFNRAATGIERRFGRGKFFVEGPRRMLGMIHLGALSGTPQPALYEKVFAGQCQTRVTHPEFAGSPVIAANSIARTHNFGVAIDEDGKLSYWGGCPESLVYQREGNNVVRQTEETDTPSITPTGLPSPDALTLMSDALAGVIAGPKFAFMEGVFIDAACSARSVALVTEDHDVVTYGGLGNLTETTVLDAHSASLGQGRETYFEDDTGDPPGRGVSTPEKLRTMRKISGSAKFERVFATPGGRLFSAYYAVREPEELDPLYGARVNPLPPAEPVAED